MFSIPRALALLAITATAVAAPVVFQGGNGRTDAPTAVPYSAHQKEYYLTQEQKDWIRPGLTVVIENFEIPANGKPVTVLRFIDDLNQPLDRLGQVTPGAISVSFVLAWYDPTLIQYTDYFTRRVTSPITGVTTAQASTDSNGTWEDLDLGRARYTFGLALPDGYDQTKTHTLAIYATRATQDIVGKNYYSNVFHDFRPDGQAITEQWAAVDDATCNTCHDPLSAHGGSRRSVKLCVTCHNPQTMDPDTGNTVDIKVMIHKIHMGANLPSVQAGHPYQIIGYQQSVNDFSNVVFPQDVRNCATCHRDSSPQGYIWYSRPNRAACGSCHDDVNFETGDNHPGGPQADDSACAACHLPQGDREFDTSIKGAHTIPTKSTQLRGLSMEILGVDGAAPGGTPTVTFRLTNGDGTFVEPSSLSSLRLLMGGPTTDYAQSFRENAIGATVSGDTASYTFQTAIPASATGTWTFSADAYRNVTIDNGDPGGLQVREAAQNPIFNAAVTDAQPVPRRQVVDLAKCNKCHDQLALHGGQRFKVEECVICHNPNGDDSGQRPADQMPAESIHLKRLIHRLHTGENLAQDFTIYGFGGSPTNFNDLAFPGDRRDCETCHIAGTYDVPLPAGTLDTPTPRDWYTPMKPAAAACLACHSTVDAAAHAYVNTAPFGEACATCHGVNGDFSVERVHAR